ncbi:MAG: hypothetical protein M3Z64_07600 [Verrucomicrobiota bacterium]|nr:hypothetical protein [Verrucomicrobiota bacterium]
MKPTPQFNESTGRDGLKICSSRHAATTPLTDYSFQASSVDRFKGHCGPSCLASFRNISGDYFKKEARATFAGESTLFAVIVVTAAIPLINSASALVQLVRSFGAL